jgi:hypothetical protein
MRIRTFLRQWLPVLGLAMVLPALVATSANRTGKEAAEGTPDVMRQKLGHSQQVLRGLALQDFAILRTNATRLVRLSHTSGWQARQSPEYELFTMEFRRSAEALVAAADAANIDAATVAYTQMTFSCVSCHKYMRAGRGTKGG